MRILKISALIIITALLFLSANRLLMPKYMTTALEGRLTPEYYLSNKNHSVIFIGDCEVFSTFSPPELWRTFGIPSFVRGGAQQLVWHSYYLLRDTLRFETPDVVVFSVLAMRYGEPQSEAYNRLNLEGMRFSRTKIQAVRNSIKEDEMFLSYFIPILRYKDRWSQLSRDDFTYFFRQRRVSHNGFMMRSDIVPADLEHLIPGLRMADYTFPEKSFYYLDKIRLLCEANDITLVLIKAPTLFPYWHAEWDEQIVRYAEYHGLLYVNLFALTDEIGIDFTTDTFNAGFHLNVYGAEKTTRFFGNILAEELGLRDMRGDADLAAVWGELLRAYDEMKAAQQREFAETGRVRTFTH